MSVAILRAALTGAARPSVQLMAHRSAPAASLFVKAGDSPSIALMKLQAKMEREGMERQIKARERYLKPKYSRQKMKKEAIYMKTKRTRVALVEAFLADSHIQPF